jgi:PST family polysaccharide transporter
LLSLNFFIGTINSVPGSLMVKNQRFKEMAMISLLLVSISAPVSIAAAYFGLGVYSLLIAPFIHSVSIFFFYRRFYPCHIDIHFSMMPIKRMASFSVYQVLFELVNYFSRNLDKLIIGRWISISALGYYEKSYRLMQLPQQNITSVLTPVLQPNFSQYQDDKKLMAEKYLKVLSFMATISFPIGAFLYMSGPEVIRLFYGPKWDAAIPCFQILALSLPLSMLNSTTGSIYQASNATKQLFIAGLVNSSVTIIGFIVASYYVRTIEALAWAWTICGSLWAFTFTFNLMFRVVFKTDTIRVIRILVKPFINAVLLFLLLGILDYSFELPVFPMAVVKSLLAFLSTILFIQLCSEYDVISFITKRLKIRKQQ